MRISGLGRFALSSCVAAAALAACVGSQPPIGAPGVVPQSPALAVRTDSTNYKTVYSFGSGSDGAKPFAGLIYVGGALYGTTIAGGGSFYCSDSEYYGCGTVYRITLGGTEKVLHDFGTGSDGQNPRAGLIGVGGMLYGTTTRGGSYACYGSSYPGCGTVFSITRSGVEKVLHSFNGYPNDGARPSTGLIDVKGTLYGTTGLGGQGECYYSGQACGTVFSITTAGAEGVLHNFTGSPDGAFPHAGLVDIKGTLYGTTAAGGKHGYGAVFSITTSGAEKLLHSFGAGSDGRIPYAGLIDVKGELYGTTVAGGAYTCGSHAGCGTVFSITPGGREKVLHSFGNGTDGANLYAGLTELNGKLYGTTVGGGAYACGSDAGCGTVFSFTPGGREKVLHSFGNGTDGASPYAGLTDVKGTLYGTTEMSGAHYYGTVFSMKP
jgi:uncharacterized repeat protein (TIGR03803 family)